MKVGFIDYYLDNWHANNYPELIQKISGGRYEVCYAYGKVESPRPGGITNKAWAEKHHIELLSTISEVVEKSDRIIVLSPDNPEMHEELADEALQSGKLVYIDKTFAPDKESAKRIFDKADKYKTPCYSSSALRFSTELQNIDKNSIDVIYSEGPGSFSMYSIHQIEPIVCLMQESAKRVMFTGNETHPAMIIEFMSGRQVHMHQCNGVQFKIIVADQENKALVYPIQSDFFGYFIQSLIEFFDTGIIPVPHEQTLDIIAIRAAGFKAMETPFTWVSV